MLAAPRSKAIGEAEKVLFVNLIEDGDYGLLDEVVKRVPFQRKDC
jgi:hypothetical protein